MINFKSIKLGKHIIDQPIFLAPMSGVSDYPFRKAVESFNVGHTVCEMIATTKQMVGNEISIKKIRNASNNILIVQLLTSNAQDGVNAAKFCQDMGADIIDINFGCPAKKVVGKDCGSSLLKNIDNAVDIIDKISNSVNVPVTVKTRIGWDENSVNMHEIAPKFVCAGAQMLTIHGRTRSQFYTGVADWEYISKVKNNVNIPVIANGDIIDYTSAKKALKTTDCDGIMVGRACQGKPWLLSEIFHNQKIDKNAKIKCVLNHLECIVDYHNTKALVMAKKHMAWYYHNCSNSKSIRNKIMSCENVNQIYDIVQANINEI